MVNPRRVHQRELGNNQHQRASHALGRGGGQPRHVRVAADDTVQNHEIRRLDVGAGLDEVQHAAFDTIG
jgi:hypothetical protein